MIQIKKEIKEGSIVRHRLSKKKYIVVKILNPKWYRKIKRCLCADGFYAIDDEQDRDAIYIDLYMSELEVLK